MSRSQHDYFAGDLFGETYFEAQAAPRKVSFAGYLPGFAICGTAALAAAWLAEHYQFPLILLGLLIGLSLSFVSENTRTAPGLDWIAKHGLRIGIVVLGLQVTFAQIIAVGLLPFLGLVLVMTSAFVAALLTAKACAQSREAGILAGGATAICGASAALALYGVIGRERLDRARFSITLVGVAMASAVAMTGYPVLADLLDLSDRQAGFLIGASVHDVAQAIGGAYSFSDAAGADATIVKLARVALLAPVVALVAMWIGTNSQGETKSVLKRLSLPWFIFGFFALVALNSAMAFPPVAADWGLTISKSLLLLAVTATAMRSQMSLLLEAGWTPLLPVFVASIASFLAALSVALMVFP